MLIASSPSGTRAIDQPQVFEAASPGHYSRPGLRWAPGAGMCRAQTASPRAAPVPCPRVPKLRLASPMGDVEWRGWELWVPPGGLGAASIFWGVLPARSPSGGTGFPCLSQAPKGHQGLEGVTRGVLSTPGPVTPRAGGALAAASGHGITRAGG